MNELAPLMVFLCLKRRLMYACACVHLDDTVGEGGIQSSDIVTSTSWERESNKLDVARTRTRLAAAVRRVKL